MIGGTLFTGGGGADLGLQAAGGLTQCLLTPG